MRLAGLLLTAILVCFALAKYLTSPIGKLRTATQKLAGGDLSSRVVPMVGRRRDELADLARDFDVMAERIETLVISQRRLNSDISHELRSPLARMNVALELAKQKSNKDTEPMLERIENESNRLNEMISRLLILAKLETNSELVEPVHIDLAQIVNEVAEDADFEAQAKGRSVTVSAQDHCTVMGSENLLRSAIENVLRNAVRYTAEGTVVDVSLKANNGHAVLQVSDHGEFADGGAAGQAQVGERVAVVREPRDLRQDGDARAHRDEELQGGDLRAAVADLGREIVVAEERADLGRERAGFAHRDEGLIGEVGEVDRAAAGERVALADDEQQRLGQQRLNGQPGFLDGQCDDCEIELALDDIPDAVAAETLPDVDEQVGVFHAAALDEGGDEVGGHGRDGPDGDAAVEGGMVAQFLGGVLDLEEDPPGAVEEGRAGFG